MSTSTDRRPLVVLIAYEFSTQIMGGSIRAIRFARHLPEFGWRVHVLTASPEHEHPEPADGVQITAIASAERSFGGGITVGETGDGTLGNNPRWLRTLAVLKRLAPLERQITWFSPFRRAVRSLFDRDPPDAVLSSCAPYVVMALGDRLSRRHRVPHLIDLRDDWRDRFTIEDRTWLNRRLLDAYAARFVRRAAGISVVSPVTERRMVHEYGVPVQLVMNGFVEDDFAGLDYQAVAARTDGPLQLLHLGWLGDFRSVAPVLEAMHSLRSGVDIRLDQYGLIEPGQRVCIEQSGVEDRVTIGPQVSHAEAVQRMLEADVLLAIPGTEIPAALSGKLFEYLRARRPILLVTGDGAARDLASRVGIRWCVAPDDPEGLVSALREMAALKTAGDLVTSTDPNAVSGLERRSGIEKLAKFMSGLNHA